MDEQLTEAFEAGELAGLHGLLVVHEGEVLTEVHFDGEDERWGDPLGEREHAADTLHDVRSVTKPVVGLLYGIALAEGKVPDVDEGLLAQFPAYADLADDPDRRALRIHHALSMTMGTEWDEDLPYSDPRNSEIAMENAPDRYRFVLDRPLVGEPGTDWTYNGGAVAIVAKLIEDGAGMPVDEYAERKLFAPLGITDHEWVHGPDGVPSAASGLRLTLRDLAKIGQLVLQEGRFDGKEVVPADWLAASFTPRADLGNGLRYGWLWWLSGDGEPPAWVAGFGNGGQRLTIQPAYDLVIAVQAGNYNEPDAWQLPATLIEKFVAPAVREKLRRR